MAWGITLIHSKLSVGHVLENTVPQQPSQLKYLGHITEPRLAFTPADLKYNAITAWDNGWATIHVIEIHTFSEHQTNWREYTEVRDLERGTQGLRL